MQDDINHQENHKRLLQKINEDKEKRKQRLNIIRQTELLRLE